MSKGENIFKRKDGRWEARYIKHYEPSGKIKYGYCYGKTYKEAKEKVMICRASIINEHKNNCNNYYSNSLSKEKTIKNYSEEWLQINKSRIKKSTYTKYCCILDKHINPEIGSYKPSDITNLVIESFTTKLLIEKDLSSKTVKDILVILKSILSYAFKQVSISINSIEIIYPKPQYKEMRVLNTKEQETLLLYLTNNMDACKFGIIVAMFTGLRLGEICALQWKDIVRDEGAIYVRKTMQRLKKSSTSDSQKTFISIDSPKSFSSVRIIPLNDELSKLCEKMRCSDKECYILTGNKTYMEPRLLQYRLKKYCCECNLADIHFHTLRHTFATRCTEAGVDIKSLSEILGHSSTSITLDRYVHSSLELKRKNMNKLSNVISL